MLGGGEQFLAAARAQPADRRARPRARSPRAARRSCGCARRSPATAPDDAEPVSVADLELPRIFASPEAREFGTYLAGAAAFYLGDWRGARERFAALRTAKDEWVRETALYMAARTELGAAGAAAMDEWGYFDLAKRDKAPPGAPARASKPISRPIRRGRYAASAAGLMRRAQWLRAARAASRAKPYARMLAAVDPATPGGDRADRARSTTSSCSRRAPAGDAGPWLLAVHDLLRMRSDGTVDEYERDVLRRYGLPPLTADELAGQEARLRRGIPSSTSSSRPTSPSTSSATIARSCACCPTTRASPPTARSQFSRQVLRGMALAELGDRNEAGFWQELLGGAKGLYQRPTVELGLALNWERAGQVAKVFAPGSPIEDERIRKILLEHSAGPEVLRAVAGACGPVRAASATSRLTCCSTRSCRTGPTPPPCGTSRWCAPTPRPQS